MAKTRTTHRGDVDTERLAADVAAYDEAVAADEEEYVAMREDEAMQEAMQEEEEDAKAAPMLVRGETMKPKPVYAEYDRHQNEMASPALACESPLGVAFACISSSDPLVAGLTTPMAPDPPGLAPGWVKKTRTPQAPKKPPVAPSDYLTPRHKGRAKKRAKLTPPPAPRLRPVPRDLSKIEVIDLTGRDAKIVIDLTGDSPFPEAVAYQMPDGDTEVEIEGVRVSMNAVFGHN